MKDIDRRLMALRIDQTTPEPKTYSHWLTIITVALLCAGAWGVVYIAARTLWWLGERAV